MRILYLTQWFDPEPAFKGASFARALADAGHDVQVVTGFPNYPGGKLYRGYRVRPFARETIESVSVHRLPLWPSHGKSTLGRVANYLSFFVSAFIYCLLRMRAYDVVYVYHPPLTPALAAALAGAIHRVPFVIDIQDLWPDSVAVSGMAPPPLVAILDRLCSFVYRRAAHIVCQSSGMAEQLARRGVPRAKLTRIYNWSNYRPGTEGETGVPADLAHAFAGRLNIVYGGNIGQAQALEYLVETAIRVQQDIPEVCLHIVGDGIERDRIATLAAAAPDAVRLYPPVPRAVMDRIFERADILALHLKDDPLFDLTIPSKLQHYLSVGKPVLAGIGGEGAVLLEQSKAARVGRPADVAAMTRNLVALAGMPSSERAMLEKSGRAYYANRLSFEAALRDTLDTLSCACHRSQGADDHA